MKVLIALIALIALGLQAPALAQDIDSSLDPWSLSGQIMVDDDARNVETFRGYHCSEIHDAIGGYNEFFLDPRMAPADGWPSFISVFAMSGADYDVLVEFYSDPPIDASEFVWSFTEADFCTTIHEDGWLVASADELANDSRFVDITVIGPIACDSGQLLMIQSGYYYWRGTWRSSYGVDWTESFSGGIPKASGTYQMDCMNIVPGDPAAFDDLVESVPTVQDNVKPTVTGLTGLDTWLWYDFTSPDSHSLVTQITVSARGTTWTLDMTAWVDEIMWNVDCETDCEYHGSLVAYDRSGVDYSLDLPDTAEQAAAVYDGGSDEDGLAAAAHRYRSRGDYIIATSAVWRGVYTFAGITYHYDAVVVSTSRTYEVVEIRSIITNP